ncbi:MAG: nonstructural protein [Microviridae sp.]|nr:MAG: nonstructural protein [Microviridae sp.]
MITKIYTVYDSKAEAYLPPFYAPTDGSALRSFATAAQTPDHEFHKFASDYTLFAIGTFDDQSATIEYHTPRSLGVALEYKNSQQ